ncbi:MAG: TlpA family protein disulfide reductase [Deltaproteobacteria bacterium]|nr:TlpA family protein disulfide reductase [Deltaproteobacteria bacterium]MBW2468189.1 TlpA family protein disulfide reductase [Deltaproteobacteria bacterium]MBW2489178.1 TlpA family protein disulfide reductase [Deltaproteobacteria bacterium]
MTLIRPRPIWSAVLLLIAFASMHVDANAGVTIEKISEAALDELIQSNNGKMVITFMAAWCGPCIDELPSLNSLYNRYKGRGLKFIGISIDIEGPRAMQPIIDKLDVGFPVYWYGEPAVKKFSIFAIPMIFLVKNDQIIKKIPGRRSEKDLEKRIRRFLDL